MEKLEEMVVLFRRVWLRRNEFVFEKKLSCPKYLVKGSLESLFEFKATQSLTKQGVKRNNNNARIAMRWERPENGWVKVNWDAALNLKERRMGAGIIVRDEKGEALVAMCDQKTNVDSPVIAECFALRMAVELCGELNIHKAVFEGDARTIIEAVQSVKEENSVFGSLIDDIKFLFQNRLDWKIQFAYRERNIVAHTLAKSAIDLLEKTIWIEEVPDFAVRSLDSDKSCIT
ncbi:hypothetical protein F2P56_000588 [Juglans regia]|uniref:Uncharacterized protein LOC108992075 n=2 Tax=Juglans regia TaxID=51240 RepID=A0A2I4ERQ6_JUGRE|nr:uncharacterized protein LOC108992075 [Juglans regia]KAF5479796.1 hypothetical protein F2P56_000588 [Juglans regia]